MSTRPNKVFIPFESLLEKITAWLRFPPPIYAVVDVARNNVAVRISRPNSQGHFLFYGGDASSVHDSREKAAHKAVKRLVTRFGVQVSDFTYDRVKMYQLCVRLFKHKCVEILQENRGVQGSDAGPHSGSSLPADDVHVSIDYAQFLEVIVKRTGVSATAIVTTWVEGQGYISWVMVTCPRSNFGMECIFSETCSEASIAQQRVAKKAALHIACRYNIEIIDVNYGTAAKWSRECCIIGEKYLILKEHVEKLKASPKQPEPLNSVLPEGYVTPNDDEVHIPVMSNPPKCPVKRKKMLQLAHEKEMGEGTSGQLVVDLPELETVFKSAKFD